MIDVVGKGTKRTIRVLDFFLMQISSRNRWHFNVSKLTQFLMCGRRPFPPPLTACKMHCARGGDFFSSSL